MNGGDPAPPTVGLRLLVALLVAWPAGGRVTLAEGPSVSEGGARKVSGGGSSPDRYQPQRRLPPSLEPILRHLTPGSDAFPEENDAAEIGARLEELGARLRESPASARDAVDRLLAPEFKGGRLTPIEEVSLGRGPSLEIWRAKAPVPTGPPVPSSTMSRSAFGDEVRALLGGLDTIRVAELLVTSIEVNRDEAPRARTEVRYDIVGTGKQAWRAERIGRWRMHWRRGGDGVWRVVEWTAHDQRRSRAATPVFTEVTEAALGANASFRRQLVPGLDDWSARLDAVFKSGGMGHHGVSMGDADGDGLDDAYVSQPAGLPNRLFRNKGDGTFEDITDAAGLAVLDGTSGSLFADVDNDGDQDLVLVGGAGLLLFVNDGKGRFSRDAEAFRYQDGLRGSPTSVAMADYDRDGFLDIYLCTYSYVIGASEDKAGTPTPYHDARNGPPNVLLRNDGHGRFVDVTGEVGLNENNDRFSFAAAWADYDEDGWPDLLVANDFGGKNLYHNEGARNGKVAFKDVAAAAGVEDYGAGMSAAWLDYDNDGRLDIYTGNMWTAAGQRVTALPGFMPDAPAEIREVYRRHARGNSLYRNRGDGTFEDVTFAAGAEMGRWAWSSDALDFDRDGWEDLYVVNGMFTRRAGERDVDLDSFFWRQVTARSPLTLQTGTAFDDAWRATNRLLMENGSQARHERNVLLRNDGRGGFDDVSGSAGLDLDQDGRSFATSDYDLDGDPDLLVMAPRSSPQLRVFRNDFAEVNAALAVRLAGTKSNRDAVGARVTVETDTLRRTRVVQAGSGFISQHSKELLFGLGKSERVRKVEVRWPSGLTQALSGVEIDHRIRIEEGSESLRSEPFRPKGRQPTAGQDGRPASAPARVLGVVGESPGVPGESWGGGTWLYHPVSAPDFTLRDLDGQERSLSALRGRPALLLFWSSVASRTTLEELGRERTALTEAGVQILTLAVDRPEDEPKVRTASKGLGVPVLMAGEVAGTYSILNRFLFDRRGDLRLPTLFLVNPEGEVVKVYRDEPGRAVPPRMRWATEVLADVGKIQSSPSERLARAVPFEGVFYSSPGERNYFQYSLDLAEQGFEAEALAGFERAAKGDPSAITFYNLGTLYMKAGRPSESRVAFERSLDLKPDYAEASNSLGALLAQSGDVPGALVRFRAALETRPDFPDALNNLGYALYQMGQDQEAYELYQKALALRPDFPEAFNNLGIFFGQQGELERAESFFRAAVEKRAGYGEAANNLALVLAARSDTAGAITVLERLLGDDPGFEMAYVTLCRIYVESGQQPKAMQVLERLLQRNPNHPLGLQILRQLRGGG